MVSAPVKVLRTVTYEPAISVTIFERYILPYTVYLRLPLPNLDCWHTTDIGKVNPASTGHSDGCACIAHSYFTNTVLRCDGKRRWTCSQTDLPWRHGFFQDRTLNRTILLVSPPIKLRIQEVKRETCMVHRGIEDKALNVRAGGGQ